QACRRRPLRGEPEAGREPELCRNHGSSWTRSRQSEPGSTETVLPQQAQSCRGLAASIVRAIASFAAPRVSEIFQAVSATSGPTSTIFSGDMRIAGAEMLMDATSEPPASKTAEATVRMPAVRSEKDSA